MNRIICPVVTLRLIVPAILMTTVVWAQGTDRLQVPETASSFLTRHEASESLQFQRHLAPRGSAITYRGNLPGGTTDDAPSSSTGAVNLLQAATYATGGYNPGWLAVGDLNGDGRPDLVVCNSGIYGSNGNTPSMSVILGNGDGTLRTPVMYANVSCDSAVIADVNGDGKADIVISGLLTVLLGNGDGSFQPPITTPFSTGGTALAVGDVNGDGKPDAIVYTGYYNLPNGTVYVQLGNGDGTFQYPPVTYEVTGYGPGAVAIGDLNADGKPDIAVVTGCAPGCNSQGPTMGQVSVLRGNGDGTFQPPLSYNSDAGGTISVAVADVNHDGKLDIVTASCGVAGCSPGSYGSVGVFLGNGDGSLQTENSYSVVSSPDAVAVADVNSDGNPDIVVGNWGPPSGFTNQGAVSVLLGNGDGTFQNYIPFSSGGNEVTAMAVADLNGDGRPDVVVSTYGDSGSAPPPGTVSILLNVTGVTQAPTTTSLISSPNPSTYGQPVTFKASVKTGSGGFSGEVQFFDGANQIGYGVLTNGQTSTSISVSSLSVGSHSITAQYLGGLGFAPSTSVVHSQKVIASTLTTVISERNPSPPGKPVLFSANVTSPAGSPPNGEIVTFYAGATVVGTAALKQGYANLTTSIPAAGVYTITAVYAGDSNFRGSTSPGLTQIVRTGAKFVTSTLLNSNLNPSFCGETVTFTATVSSVYGSIPNGDVVKFYDGFKYLGSGTTVAGMATFASSTLKATTHIIKATYQADANFGSSSGTISQVVTPYATTTTLVSSMNPSSYGQAVTWTATVTSVGPNPPTGKVKFIGLGAATLNGGVATLTKTWLNAATYPTTAEYLGDAASAPSSSSELQQVVNPASTTTALTSSASPSSLGESVTFTAEVTSSTGAHPTGTVTFTAGGTMLGTVPLIGIIATVSTSTLPVGSSTIEATYNGATDFVGSTTILTQMVSP